MALLTGQGLALGYEGKKVVEELSFSVDSGDYLCLVGENGSGKSTLVKTIVKLIPPIKGQLLTGDGLEQNEIGYLPQQAEVQKDFPASVKEIVLSGCLNRRGLRPFYTREEKGRAAANMERLGIAQLAGSCYRELSGGQQRRVLLARALCATRRLLLLDEPAAGLDPNAAAVMYQLIEELNTAGLTIIMVSHDMAAAIKYAGYILHIGRQKPLFFGKKSDYAANAPAGAFSPAKGDEA
jgi:zinc transport system ATP-binding protein